MSRESIPIAVLDYVTTDPERVIGYVWIDYRSDGRVLAVYRDLESDTTEALSFSEGMWITASDEQPWQPDPSALSAISRIPTVATIKELADEGPDVSGDPTATRQQGSDGSVLWALTDDGDGTTREWVVGETGSLQFYRVTNPNGLEGGVSKIIYEFGIAEDEPVPLIVPQVGTPLHLPDLGIPRALSGLKVIE